MSHGLFITPFNKDGRNIGAGIMQGLAGPDGLSCIFIQCNHGGFMSTGRKNNFIFNQQGGFGNFPSSGFSLEKLKCINLPCDLLQG